MAIAPAIVIGLCIFGAVLLSVGTIGLIRDGRRIATPIYIVFGLGLLALGIGMWLVNLGHSLPITILLIVTSILFLLGNIIGYPALTIFLLYSGLTILRKESRSLGNALALLAGIGLFFLPSTVRLLAPSDIVSTDFSYMLRYGAHLTVMLVLMYFGFAFAAFIAASLLYRRRRIRTEPEAIIILGSGLINGKVPPLLAARLECGFAVQTKFGGRPMIITSGGQGEDEPRPEGEAMRDYLIENGADASRVVAETESRTTEENLRFSSKMLSDPSAPIVVATNNYHVFRAALLTRTLELRAHVVGAPTAWYYFPSAFIREFVGVIRDRFRFTVLSICVLIIMAVSFTIIIVPAMVPGV
ncbi:MAG TPA: YdcF family protein [Corynebacterium sp.]|nr:YdcF family protein [Corynebacterium sp.]